MANLIIEKSPTISWYTDLHPFFSLIESTVRERLWLWTDVELSAPWPVPATDDGGAYVIGGDMLLEIVAKRPQFIWSVLSALPIDAPIERTTIEAPTSTIETVPYADGNRDLWRGEPSPQHPLAEFEIVCWDSGATLLIGGNEMIAAAFLKAYPGAVDLDALNRSRALQ